LSGNKEDAMKQILIAGTMILGMGCAARAQAPAGVTDVVVCDVVRKPAPFDGKMVRIKGTVVVGFDEFVIKDAADPNCGFEVNAIWLQYPQGTKGKAGPASMLTIQPAHNFTGKYAHARGGDARQEQGLQAIRFTAGADAQQGRHVPWLRAL
jgi:hypothetical protein